MLKNLKCSFKAATLVALMLSLHPALAGETVLYKFKGGSDGIAPADGVIADGKGNLYGTTQSGGIVCDQSTVPGCGTVFEIAKSGKERVLHAFGNDNDGTHPFSVAGCVR